MDFVALFTKIQQNTHKNPRTERDNTKSIQQNSHKSLNKSNKSPQKIQQKQIEIHENPTKTPRNMQEKYDESTTKVQQIQRKRNKTLTQ